MPRAVGTEMRKARHLAREMARGSGAASKRNIPQMPLMNSCRRSQNRRGYVATKK